MDRIARQAVNRVDDHHINRLCPYRFSQAIELRPFPEFGAAEYFAVNVRFGNVEAVSAA